jgi:hypothetical protein
VGRAVERLDLLVHLLRPVVLVHWAIRGHELVGAWVLLVILRNRRTTELRDWLAVLDDGLRSWWRRLLVLRLLVVLVRRVSV